MIHFIDPLYQWKLVLDFTSILNIYFIFSKNLWIFFNTLKRYEVSAYMPLLHK